MTLAKIKVEYNCGDSILNCFTESKRLATLLNVWVEFNFNEVTCLIHNQGNIEYAVLEYKLQLDKKEGVIKIVIA